MAEFASKGVAGTGLGLGIAGTALGLLDGNFGNLFGGRNANGCGTCNEDHFVNRYEMEMENKIVSKDTEIALLKSNIYTDQKLADVYDRLSARIRGVEDQLCQQAVYNATNTATLSCLQQQIAQLQSLTEMVIPASHVCPAPMPRYNSWEAPTTPTPAA